jgi:threonine aldolase
MKEAIDLRSDTFTKPTEEMKRAMFDAPVGDDVFDEDPSINQLQEKTADLFGMEAALFCPSGTMTNQIALKVHTQAGDEIICHKYSHIYNYEGGGLAFNSGCQTRLLEGKGGLIDPKTVEANINPDNIHAATTSLISMENTSNKGGGSCYELNDLEEIYKISRKHNLAYHLDGARLFNALVHKKQSPKDYGKWFDSISICLSKGLGCPVGSLILGTHDFMKKAKRVRKKFGGGMRQAGYLAGAGIYALDHHIDRLQEDHDKALMLKRALENCAWVKEIDEVETNIVIFYLKEGLEDQIFLNHLEKHGIKAISMGQGKLRFVTHLDVSMGEMEEVGNILSHLPLSIG